MNCRKVRDHVAGGRATAEIERHVADCDGCREFARNFQTVRDELRRHHAGAMPDASFAHRVGSRLRADQPVEVLGWAALKLLPLSLVVALALAWLAWDREAAPLESPGQDVVVVAESDPLEWLFDSRDGTP
jgi:hypothetical protein